MMLPCSHKYCEHCLRVWSGVHADTYEGPTQLRFPCRVCWHHINVPHDRGMASFRQNVDVENLGLTLQHLSVVGGGAEVSGVGAEVAAAQLTTHNNTDHTNTNNMLCRDDVNMNALTTCNNDVTPHDDTMMTSNDEEACNMASDEDPLTSNALLPMSPFPHSKNYAFPTWGTCHYNVM